jgi:hypothetical protein
VTNDSPWTSLSVAVAKAAADTSSSRIVTVVLEAIVSAQTAELDLLRGIRRDVRRLIEGPFKSGQQFLDQASRRQPGDPERASLIRLARDRFTDALSVEGDPARQSVIALHLALSWLLLNDPAEARLWLERAHNNGEHAVDSLVAEGKRDPKLLTGNNVVDGIVFFVSLPAAALWEKRLEQSVDRQLREAHSGLTRLFPFVHALARMRIALGENPGSIKNRWTLLRISDDHAVNLEMWEEGVKLEYVRSDGITMNIDDQSELAHAATAASGDYPVIPGAPFVFRAWCVTVTGYDAENVADRIQAALARLPRFTLQSREEGLYREWVDHHWSSSGDRWTSKPTSP